MTNSKSPAPEATPVETAAAPPASPAPDADLAAELEQMRVDLEAAQSQAAEHLITAQRTVADFANYRRRITEEREAESQNATDELLRALLPVLDDFERAASARPPDLATSAWADGIAVIERKLRATLEASGVSVIDTRGARFDPRYHQAIDTTPSAPEFEGLVVAEASHGYLRAQRVLRPAQVTVGVPIISDHQETTD